MKITKVYTRTGDKGETSLVGGVRRKKSDIRLEAYGTIDELSAHLGLLAAMLGDCQGATGVSASKDKTATGTMVMSEHRDVILRVQNTLFHVGTHLATDQETTPLYPSALLPKGEVEHLEQLIDQMNAQLPESQGFILPGGALAAAQSHVARTVCRRAERRIVALMEVAKVDDEIVQYVNRLSDYLFVLAKIINFNTGVQEILWENACK